MKKPKKDEPLKIETWPIGKVLAYAKNARLHSDEQIDIVAKSITEFGFVNPCLVDADGVLIAGHCRILSSKKLGMKTVPVIRLGHLTEQQARALRIADNQLPMRATWDAELLRLEVSELKLAGFDMPLLGFDTFQLVEIMTPPNEGETDPEAVPEPPVNPVSRIGDLWELGNHRLLCGDCTKADDVTSLLGKVKPHLMVTDPPYGVDYDPDWRVRDNPAQYKGGKTTSVGVVHNDTKIDWLDAWILFPGSVAYLWHADRHASQVQTSIEAAGFQIRCQIIWAKQGFVFGRGDYHWQHEPCWYAVKKGAAGQWHGDRKQTTLWEIANLNIMKGGGRDDAVTGHSTQKPIECMKRPMENNSRQGDSVYDPFVGSGTSIIASEMTGRKCYALEISSAYVDVCIKRWEAFAGKKAMLDGRTLEQVAKARRKPTPQAPPATRASKRERGSQAAASS